MYHLNNWYDEKVTTSQSRVDVHLSILPREILETWLSVEFERGTFGCWLHETKSSREKISKDSTKIEETTISFRQSSTKCQSDKRTDKTKDNPKPIWNQRTQLWNRTCKYERIHDKNIPLRKMWTIQHKEQHLSSKNHLVDVRSRTKSNSIPDQYRQSNTTTFCHRLGSKTIEDFLIDPNKCQAKRTTNVSDKVELKWR